MNRADHMAIARLAVTDPSAAIDLFVATADSPAWAEEASDLRAWFDAAGELPAPHTWFRKGNGKLPFYTFSTLPVVTCPGAGACLEWCYSLKAWRCPGAFGRQLQLTIALQSPWGRRQVLDALAKVSGVLRLYVDGDVSSADVLAFWCEAIFTRPDLSVYSYTKSLDLIIGADLPSNWTVNVSSGHRHTAETERQALAHPNVRGTFTAVPTPRGASRATVASIGREIFGRAVFACPGKCGECRPNGDHACGSARFQGVPIVIGEH